MYLFLIGFFLKENLDEKLYKIIEYFFMGLENKIDIRL